MIGIVVLNYNTWEKTIHCVESILTSYTREKVIVIVDNSSPNDSYHHLSEYVEPYSEVKLVRTPRNGGFSYGNNFGFSFICQNFPEVEKVVLTNNDIIFKKDSIAELIDSFSLSKDVCIVAPLVYDTEGRKTNIPWKSKPNIWQFIGLQSNANCQYSWVELAEDTSVYGVSGCCFVVDKSLFISIGLLDENVFLYEEEAILSVKIKDKGYSMIFNPKAQIIHEHGATTGKGSLFLDKEMLKSILYFLRVYDHRSLVVRGLVYLFFIVRFNLKALLGKYSKVDGIFSLVKDTYKRVYR